MCFCGLVWLRFNLTVFIFKTRWLNSGLALIFIIPSNEAMGNSVLILDLASREAHWDMSPFFSVSFLNFLLKEGSETDAECYLMFIINEWWLFSSILTNFQNARTQDTFNNWLGLFNPYSSGKYMYHML